MKRPPTPYPMKPPPSKKARLTPEQARAIKERHRAGERLADLAAEHGVCYSIAWRATRRVEDL